MSMMKLKPYDLVLVTHRVEELVEWTMAGEVISYPVLGDPPTIMVRTVPNDPSTMVEMEVADLKPVAYPGEAKFVSYAVARGTWSFPWDMLRYDRCVPVGFRLEEQEGVVCPVGLKIGHQLIVAKVHGDRNEGVWTHDRWWSFLWTVTPLHCLRIKKGGE